MVSKESIKEGIKSELVARVVYTASTGICVVFLARALGPDPYGLLFYAITVLSVFKLFSALGIAKAASKYIADFVEGKTSKIRPVIRISMFFSALSILAVSAILFFLNEPIARFLGEPGTANLLRLGVLFIVSSTVYTYLRTIFLGFTDISWSAIVYATDGVGRVAFVVLFVSLGWGVYGGLMGYILGFTLAALVGGYKLYSYYASFDSDSGTSRKLMDKIFRYNLVLFVTRSARSVDQKVDILLIGYFMNPAAVGFYTVAKQIITFVHTPASSVGHAIGPRFSEANLENSPNKLSILFHESLRYMLVLYLPATVGILLVADPLVLLVFGGEYGPTVPTLQILTVFLFALSIASVTDNALDYLGLAKRRAQSRVITAGLNIGLNIALIPQYGIRGAAGATAVSFSIYVLINLFSINNVLTLQMRRLGAVLGRISLVTMVMGSIVLWILTIGESQFFAIPAAVAGAAVWGILVQKMDIIDLRTELADIL